MAPLEVGTRQLLELYAELVLRTRQIGAVRPGQLRVGLRAPLLAFARALAARCGLCACGQAHAAPRLEDEVAGPFPEQLQLVVFVGAVGQV